MGQNEINENSKKLQLKVAKMFWSKAKIKVYNLVVKTEQNQSSLCLYYETTLEYMSYQLFIALFNKFSTHCPMDNFHIKHVKNTQVYIFTRGSWIKLPSKPYLCLYRYILAKINTKLRPINPFFKPQNN